MGPNRLMQRPMGRGVSGIWPLVECGCKCVLPVCMLWDGCHSNGRCFVLLLLWSVFVVQVSALHGAFGAKLPDERVC